ncbi:MAG: 1-(5-phosphoribosyl)-5-((5-phosphoribosylamino)methylideneamino)imidazole-4-carboxamide isomerase [Spirochaetaceae bacterium]|nr:MAG: 1-(5-phosphoribosyl)-5-((5-phosphoribosylamino)methylideneamino)imidazole-4-carboxamide isomerase [Spirochaetaceae bacterium]
MTVLPAIDLLGGSCVRLTRGDYNRVNRYSRDPVAVAREFEAAGARWIHLVDLDAARGRAVSGAGRSHVTAGHADLPAARSVDQPAAGSGNRSPADHRNRRIIQAITGEVSCNIQIGGGIRRLEDVEELLQAGAKRLIVGTILVKDPEEVRRWCRLHPGLLWAGIDADRGTVKVSGWEQEAAPPDVELAVRVGELGLAGIVYTSIGRDGTLGGPDIERTNRIAEVSGMPVILSGGIGSMEDVRRVADQGHPGIEGLIIGKAIYEGRVDLRELLRA